MSNKLINESQTNQLSLQLINKNIDNLFKDSTINPNNNTEGNNEKISEYPKLNKIIESLYKATKSKISLKFMKYSRLLSYNKKIKIKKYNNIEKAKVMNIAISRISLYIFKDYINNKKHNHIQEYLKLLIYFISNKILEIDNFFLILDIILKSILDIVKDLNNQLYTLKNEPFLFINDIIEAISNCPSFDIVNNDNFVEKLKNLFNNFYESSKKQNIYIERDELWLKLYENKTIDNNYNKFIDSFLINIYKNHIPKHFINEIYKKSVIDLPYFLNILELLKKLYIEENIKKFNRTFSIKQGIYFLGNSLEYSKIDFKTNEFSLIFSFKIKEMKNKDEIILFNLMVNEKKSLIRFLINKNNNLIIINNDNSNYNTKIIIKEDIFYFCCLVFNKNKKNSILYINTDKGTDKGIANDQKIIKYSMELAYPLFDKNMIMKLGEKNFYGILGDLIIINKELDQTDVENLFNSKEYYSHLLNFMKDINIDLIKDISFFSKSCLRALNQFKIKEYECLLKINQNLFFADIKKNKINNLEIFEYKTTHSIFQFLEEKGIDFLIFMLHNINSQIKDNKLFNLYLQKTIDFLYITVDNYQQMKNKIIEDKYVRYDSYFVIDEEKSIKKFNLFFITLLAILKDDNNRKLSQEVRNALIQCLSLTFDNFYFHKNIIISILFDNELFDQKKFISDLNNKNILKNIDIPKINKELIYKILLLDFIFESKNVKHKNYNHFIESLIQSNNIADFSNILINYIYKIKSEVKIYHYLKIIYYNFEHFRKGIKDDIIFELYKYSEMKLGILKNSHCKYCSYIIILCYLIKGIIINRNIKDNKFTYNSFGFMISPPFLFIRCIFIQNFEMNNSQKFKFIKTKGKNIYNWEYFDSLEKSPLELYNYNDFIQRFNSIIKYIEFLFNLERTQDLNNVIDNFFLFIIEFIHKIRSRHFLRNNKKITEKKAEKYISDLINSQEFTDFLILYLKFNKEKALKIINKYISSSFIQISNPFIIYILSKNNQFEYKKDIDYIKIGIMKMFLLKNININDTQVRDDLILFLLLIYNNIYEENISISEDFPKLFMSICNNIISDNNFFLDIHPLNLDYSSHKTKTKKYIEDIKEKGKEKFISEIIVDILFKFYLKGYYNTSLINDFLIKANSSSIFYLRDIDNLQIKKQKSSIKRKSSFYKKESDNFLFCLYFLIIFLNMYSKYRNQKTEITNLIHIMVDILFNELKKIYNKYKIPSLFSKIKNPQNIFILYNKMFDIFNKYYKSPDFNFNFMIDKYNNIINQKEYNKLVFEESDQINYIDIDGIDEIEYNLYKSDYKTKRSNSLETIVKNKIKKKYLEKYDENMSYQNLDNNYLNQTMITIMPIDLNEKKEILNKPLDSQNDKEEKYLKKELSKENILDIYYQKIITESNSLETIKMLFNPKEYFIWKNFTVYFKDLIFKNKKFKTLSKIFEIYTRNIKVSFSSQRDKEFFLNYPSKIKNYITDEYCRPFVKPCLNFFNYKDINKSHPYMNENLLINPQFKEDYFYLIKFRRIIPHLKERKEENIIKCERVQNKGNIFGYIELNNDYMIFVNSPEDDERNINAEKRIEYTFTILDDSIIDRNKYDLLFYRDIKEIIKRRFCFNYVGYEIFMKDNRSYLFNFFNKRNINLFFEKIKFFFLDFVNEENKKSNYIKNNNNLKKINCNFRIINDPLNFFKKKQFQKSYMKGEISNYNYILLLNKYSSRSFNDINQYLIFPFLFMNVERTRKRDLSKAISLNKENNSATLKKIKTNKKITGYHFNQHYSSGGFIYYYLVRLIPLTYSHIEFQSGKFDLPARLFNSIQNFLCFLNLTNDNRELIPEFYYNYEFLLNLNYNDFDVLSSEDEYYQLHNVITNKNETFLKFIIELRKQLETFDISPWIDIIFGFRQFDDSDEHPNSFPFYGYEAFNEFDEILEDKLKPIEKKAGEIKHKIDLLRFGMAPAQLFNTPHPKVINEIEEEITNFDKKSKYLIETIKQYINKKIKEKEEFCLFDSNNDNEIKLIFKFHNKIDIFILKLGENKYNEISISISSKDQVDYELNNIYELLPQIYCIILNKDNTIQFFTSNKIIKRYQWTCMITAIGLYSKKIKEDNNIKKVIIGDEEGYLHILHIEYEISKQDKLNEIKTIKIDKSIKAHCSLIKGITYDERLNIIISWSDEGVICINNDYSLNYLNIIELEAQYEIQEILVSKYNTLIVNCHTLDKKQYRIICYTLSGIKISDFESTLKIMKIIHNEKIIVAYNNRNIFYYNFDDLTMPYKIVYADNNKIGEGNKLYIKHCIHIPQLNKLLLIYSNNKVSFQSIDIDEKNIFIFKNS